MPDALGFTFTASKSDQAHRKLATDTSAVASDSGQQPIIVIGTYNLKKCQELAELLAPLRERLKTLADMPAVPAIAETGSTFAANAKLKAAGYAVALNQWVLADDSGLEVDALDGAPGVHSARFAGANASDAANNAHLLARLADVPDEKRTARYVCHVAVAAPDGSIRARAEDTCVGRIKRGDLGSGGFGYDPLFEIVEYHRTFGELSPAVKAVLSHRARAIRAILPSLRVLLATA